MPDTITVRDVLTDFAARPSHPPIDDELVELREKAAAAWKTYNDKVNERYYLLIHGADVPDLEAELNAAVEADRKAAARWKELNEVAP